MKFKFPLKYLFCAAILILSACTSRETIRFIEAPSDQPVVCTLIYLPVCGANGISYPNECEANAAKVKITSQGECPKVERSERKACTREFNPTCGLKDGVFSSYPNPCEVEAQGAEIADAEKCQ